MMDAASMAKDEYLEELSRLLSYISDQETIEEELLDKLEYPHDETHEMAMRGTLRVVRREINIHHAHLLACLASSPYEDTPDELDASYRKFRSYAHERHVVLAKFVHPHYQMLARPFWNFNANYVQDYQKLTRHLGEFISIASVESAIQKVRLRHPTHFNDETLEAVLALKKEKQNSVKLGLDVLMRRINTLYYDVRSDFTIPGKQYSTDLTQDIAELGEYV